MVKRAFTILTILFIPFLAGCAFRTITAGPAPLADYKPTLASTIVVREFKSEKLSEEQRKKLIQQIVGELKKEAAFENVLEIAPETANKDQIVFLDGEIVQYEEGSKAAQWFIGFGAGRSKLSVAFRLLNNAGQTITTFSAKRTYGGGAFGIGGPSLLSMEDLIGKIAHDIGQTVSKWKRGEQVGKEAKTS